MRPLVVALIWGSLFYSLLYLLPTSDYVRDNFLASALSVIDDTFNKQAGVINVFNDKGNLENTVFHIGKDIDVYDIEAAAGSADRIFAGTNQGLFVSRDKGINWYQFSDAEHLIGSDAKVYKILFDEKGKGFVSVYWKGRGFVYESSDNFFSLDKIFEVEAETAYDFASDGAHLFLGLSDGRLISFSLALNKFRTLNTFASAITNLKVENKGNLIFVALKDDGFWVSENGGRAWSRRKYLADYRGAENIQDLGIDQKHNNMIYAATDYGLIRSADLGSTWQVFRSLPTEKAKIRALALIPNPGELYVATPDKVYKSTDFGSSWEILEPKIGGREISVITPFHDRIIVGTKR